MSRSEGVSRSMVLRKASHSWWRSADQLAIEIVQRSEQGERPVADIVVGLGLGLDVADA
jgi:hypothetical protein